ncbi:MAG: hypothetical protein AAF682_26615 [Planctomycetota bacterium]
MLALLLTPLLALPPAAPDAAEKQAQAYAAAVDKLNASHARKPQMTEEELAAKLPSKAEKALSRLLEMDDSEELLEALVTAGEAALDLDRIDDFERVRKRLGDVPAGGRLGVALSRPRYLLRGIGGLDEDYLEHFAEVFDAVLEGYDDLFGFQELSKVPGKKLRVRVHLEDKITRPPHFAPQFPYHSEIDFPVVDAEAFRSPTSDGKFLFYGLCHELGHVIAMWGDRSNEEDRHAWAHYTGVVVCEYVSKRSRAKALSGVRDSNWRSLDALRKEFGETEPSLETKDGVSALLVALHDVVGTEAIGAAINYLDEKDARLRINRVRYYSFRELEEGFAKTLKKKKDKKRVAELLKR